MKNLQLGIRANILNFLLLVLISFFVGSMVGLERTILPVIGEEEFGLVSVSATLSFIISFGFSKAVVNYFAGEIADRFGRKKVLIIGWSFGIFVPLLVIFATSWWMIIVANIFLGINQGLAWSMTVNMKLDMAKSTERGLVTGLNEFAGYTGLSVMAAVSGFIASSYSNRPEPFILGIVIVIIGTLLSFFTKDTGDYLKMKVDQLKTDNVLSAKEVFVETSLTDKNLSSITFSGLTTNLKDGMVWGLFPLFFISSGLSLSEISVLIAIYPATWGIVQLGTGILSDRIGRKHLIVSGMLIQGVSLWMILLVQHYELWVLASILLGVGTAMVYPTLQASISDVARPEWRAASLGVYRFWRDSGYAFGALFAGLITDLLDVNWGIGLVALFPLIAGILAFFRLKETLPLISSTNK